MDRQMAVVLLDQSAEVDMQAVTRAIKARYPALPAEPLRLQRRTAREKRSRRFFVSVAKTWP
jgi:hypothetical protein